MDSQNFEILREVAPDLANAGAYAEAYLYSDPASSAVKLRIVAEQLALHVYSCCGFEIPDRPRFQQLIEEPAFQSVTPEPIRLKFDAIRIHGNHGAHGDDVTSATAEWLLKETHRLVCWFLLTYSAKKDQDCPEFSPLPVQKLESKFPLSQRPSLSESRSSSIPYDLDISFDQEELQELECSIPLGDEEPWRIDEGYEPVADVKSMLARSSLNDAVERFAPTTALLNATKSVEKLGIS